MAHFVDPMKNQGSSWSNAGGSMAPGHQLTFSVLGYLNVVWFWFLMRAMALFWGFVFYVLAFGRDRSGTRSPRASPSRAS